MAYIEKEDLSKEQNMRVQSFLAELQILYIEHRLCITYDRDEEGLMLRDFALDSNEDAALEVDAAIEDLEI